MSFLCFRSRSPAADPAPVRGRLCKQPSVDDLEMVSCQLEPKVEGRILQLTPVRIFYQTKSNFSIYLNLASHAGKHRFSKPNLILKWCHISAGA
jgi:hypothetical protein